MDAEFRPCVLAVFVNESAQVLVAERKSPRGAWQFPQGGIEAGETPEQAVVREMKEELGLEPGDVVIVRRTVQGIRYVWPGERENGPYGERFKGQEQVWFLLRLSPGAVPDLARATDHEFVATEWVSPEEALGRIIDFKREAYVAGLRELGLRIEAAK
jgi:putative (di)nucleoside polyphosphate hydrolase